MAIASLAQRTTTFTTTTTANVEYRTTASVIANVLEFSYISATATAQQIGLGRPQLIGVTPVNVLFQRDHAGDPACVTAGSLSWATSPTVPLIFHRRANLSATLGVGIVWTFPRGLKIPVSSSLVCWNISTTVASDIQGRKRGTYQPYRDKPQVSHQRRRHRDGLAGISHEFQHRRLALRS